MMRGLGGFARGPVIGIHMDRLAKGAWDVRVLVLKGHRIIATHAPTLDADTTLSAAVAAALSVGVLSRRRGMSVVVALGSGLVQCKALPGLPGLADDRVLTEAVRENVSRFFLRNGIPLVTSAVCRDEQGDVWGAAVERPVLETIQAACGSARQRLTAVVPAMTVVRSLADPDLHSPFAAARAAAVRGRHDGVSWLPLVNEATQRRIRRRRGVGVSSLVGVVAIAAAILPTFMAHLSSNRDQAIYRRNATQARRADSIAQKLDEVSSRLNDAALFAIRRRDVTTLLAGITRALPSGDAVLSFATDSVGGTIVVVAPHAGEVLGIMAQIPGIANPEITGPVTEDAMRGTAVNGAAPPTLEHATVRFRWLRGGATP